MEEPQVCLWAIGSLAFIGFLCALVRGTLNRRSFVAHFWPHLLTYYVCTAATEIAVFSMKGIQRIGLPAEALLLTLFFISPLLAYYFWRAASEPRFQKETNSDHRCVSCGYDLTGNISGVCPECGESIF